MSDFASTLTSAESTPSARTLAPARALLTPAWIAALALLIANDHLFKGSGLLPGAVTGKLSDFAGLLMAPALLAAVVGVRSRRALAACHVAVGLVFAGIQLSLGFADQWSALMGATGHPWVITRDPSDLIALPMLLVSWALFVPHMQVDPNGEGAPSLWTPWKRAAVGALTVVGLWSTVATSEGPDLDDTWYQDVFGQLYINNANDFEIGLFIRPLRDDLSLDCGAVAEDPGRLLNDAAFGEAEHWLLPGRTNVAIAVATGQTGQGSCGAALVAGEGIPPQIVFFDASTYGERWFSGQTFEVESLDVGGMAVVFGDSGGEWIGGEDVRFTPDDSTPPQDPVCDPSPAESRVDWSPVETTTPTRIESLDPGVDGCFGLELQPVVLEDNEVTDVGSPFPWYLCVPAATMPFQAGDIITAEATLGGGGTPMRTLEVHRIDPTTMFPEVDGMGRFMLRALYNRGASATGQLEGDVDANLVSLPTLNCPWQVEAGCATVERTIDVGSSDAVGLLEIGETVVFEDDPGGDGYMRTAVLSYARERAVIDTQCVQGGAASPSLDLDLAVVWEPQP